MDREGVSAGLLAGRKTAALRNQLQFFPVPAIRSPGKLLLLILVGLLLVLTAGIWFARDLPRRKVEWGLAERLGAEVKIGSLEIQGLRHIVLHGVTVRRMPGQPRLDVLHAGAIVAMGDPGGMVVGRFEVLRISDVEVRLVPPEKAPGGPPVQEPVAFSAQRLEIERAQIVIASAEAEARIEADALFTGVPESPEGTIHLRADQIPVAPVMANVLGVKARESVGDPNQGAREPTRGRRAPAAAAAATTTTTTTAGAGAAAGAGASAATTATAGTVAGAGAGADAATAATAGAVAGAGAGADAGAAATPTAGAGDLGGLVEGFEATITVAGAGRRIGVIAHAASATIKAAGRSLAIPKPSLDASLERDVSGGTMRVQVHPRVDFVGSFNASVDLDAASHNLIDASVEVRALDPGPLLEFLGLLPPGSRLDAKADIDVKGSGRNLLDYGLTVEIPHVEFPLGKESAASPAAPEESAATSTRAERSRHTPSEAALQIDAQLRDASHAPARLPAALRTDVPGRARRAALSADGASFRAEGTVRFDEAARGLSVRARLALPQLAATLAGFKLPTAIVPATGSFDGEIATESTAARVIGRLSIETATAGRLEATGSVSFPLAADGLIVSGSSGMPGTASGTTATSPVASGPGPRPTCDAKWIWKGAELERLAGLLRESGVPLPREPSLSGSLEAEGLFAGRPDAPRIDGTIAVSSLNAMAASTDTDGDATAVHSRATPRAAQARWSLRKGSAKARISWLAGSDSIDVHDLAIRGDAVIAPLSAVSFEITGSGRAGLLTGELCTSALQFDMPGLARVQTSGCVVLADMNAWRETAPTRAGPGTDALAGTATSKMARDVSAGHMAPSADIEKTAEPLGPEQTVPSARAEKSVQSRREDKIVAPARHLTPSPNLERNRGAAGDGGSRTRLRLHVEGIDLTRWQEFLKPVLGVPAPGYQVKGAATVDVTGDMSAIGVWRASGAATISKSGFASEDGARVLEGLETVWDVKLDGGGSGTVTTLQAAAKAGGFQLLWGDFFADGSSLPSTLEITAQLGMSGSAASHAGSARDAWDRAVPTENPARSTIPDENRRSSNALAPEIRTPLARVGRREPGGGEPTRPGSSPTPWRVRALWSFPDGPRAEASLESAGNEDLAYTLRTDVPDLGEAVDRYLRIPLGDSAPFLHRLEMGGRLHAEVRGVLSKPELTLRGRLNLEDLRVAGTGGYAEIEGLGLDLPVDLTWARLIPSGRRAGEEGRPPTGPPLNGSIRFSKLAIGGLAVPPVETGLRIQADTVALEEGLAVPLFGGVLGFEDLRLIELLRGSRHLETVILLSNLSLGEATKALGPIPLEGNMDGYFPRVRLGLEQLQVEGGGEISIFGGTLKLGGISGEDILTRYPKVTFSADFENIDLERITHRFDFGDMTGIIQGYVHGCELFRGVPVAMDAAIETVRKEGDSRTVNVKAINNIAILGTGSSIGVFDRGIHKLFDNYNYAQLGVGMTLKNDVFLVRGLVHDQRKEFFLKGRLPFPINVVNAQPGTTVSFRAMVERLKSLDFSKATAAR